MEIKAQIISLREEALMELEKVTQAGDLELWRVRYLGKKSRLTEVLRGLAALPVEERRDIGAFSNSLKTEWEAALAVKEAALRQQAYENTTVTSLDISLPGRPYAHGHTHLMTQSIAEICSIFQGLGFQVVEGPRWSGIIIILTP